MATHTPHASSRRRLSVPANAWDAHTHVTDPSRFPPSSKAAYKVHPATLAQARAAAARLGVPNQAYVQTSTYGTDNAWILWCLAQVGAARSRGVVVIPECESASDADMPTLRAWHAQGVRGVRLNFTSVKRAVEPAELAAMLRVYADVIRPLGTWALHLYMPLKLMGALRPLVGELGVKVVVDHFGDPPSLEGPMARHEGWSELLRVLENPNCFVKISAPYRFTDDPEFRALEPLARELMGVRDGKAVVFASDWPHTRFEDTDIKPWVERCLEWCDGDESRAIKLFRSNAEELFDVSSN